MPSEESTRCLAHHPAVCCVGVDYDIIFLCHCRALASVLVAGVTYTDNNNGVMRTDTLVHKIRVPGSALNAAGTYTIHLAPLADHCNYFPKPEPTQAYTYVFHPIPEQDDTPVHAVVLADTHGDAVTPPKAALAAGEPQLLILDGDIGDSADTVDMITTMHRLAATITRGTYPVVYARGNHDTRGHNAEHLTEYVPTRDGATYFTFRQGPVWGIVLDAGEDKPDDREEYGGVCDYPVFRRAQSDYMASVIARKEQEFEAPGVRYRIAVCHMPFHYSKYAFTQTTPDIYATWVHLLNAMHLDVLLCGHDHCIDELDGSIYAGEEKPNFPTWLCAVMDGHPQRGRDNWIGGQYTCTHILCKDGHITHTFINQDGQLITL